MKNCSDVLEKAITKYDEIILVNVHKNIVLPAELLQKVEVLKLSMLIASFEGKTPKEFYKHCRQQLTRDIYDTANELTVEQCHVPLWFVLRLGRITTSSIYKASIFNTVNHTLVQKILGEGENIFNSPPSQRGALLEIYVFNELLKEFPGLRQSGIVIDEDFPVIGASPDGIHDDFVLEIKCPYAAHTLKKYLDIKTLDPQYLAQIQLQMHITKKEKALLAVAAVDFELTRNYTKVWIKYNKVYCDKLIKDALVFYESYVFPKLMIKYRENVDINMK